ncbi:GNAT family N-acetyltransferase [uncultured Sulfitobacter sp.]|uniref:GNAT family N-acetyltransferase n=1 Tax=uncultured Sulfitobacter sp. TaxID=191468 RepID=UPI00261E5BF9|nr:GNAT family N-acetyltransferase [uncultured Sulfitobacter sp.]
MIVIAPTDEPEVCYALRHRVFVEEQGYTVEGEVDDLDPHSHHLLALDGETPVATARIYLDGPTARIGRVCVLKSHRGQGLGADLITAAVQLAGAHPGISRAVLGAQAHATGFYGKLGFTAFGAPYDDEGEPHQMMERPL